MVALRCQLGEQAAWEDLVAHFERPLFYYVRRLVASDQDAVQALQDTWVRAFKSLPTLGDPDRIAPWLYTLARRSAAASRVISSGHPAAQVTDDHAAAPVDDGQGETADAIHSGLERMNDRSREVLTLFYLDDLSLADIAAVLDIPPGTVKSRLHAARRELRAVLQLP